jgi:diguanylate cyclase (GGDEF)-like protein/PAS domain S-box-containing protein
MDNIKDVAAWRERIFASMLPTILVVGSLSTLAAVPFLLSRGMWTVALADVAALGWICAIWRFERLGYTMRVLHFLAVVYALSITLLLSVGAASLSYLLGPPLLAAVLLSLRPALVALAVGAASLVALGATGHVSLNLPGWEHDPVKASLVAALNYATIGLMLTLICTALLKGLSQSLGELGLTSAAVSRLNDMVVIARAADASDDTRPITFANDAFLSRTGYARDQVIGQSLHMLRGPATDRAVFAGIVEAMRDNRSSSAELMVYQRGGQAFWVELEVVPFSQSGQRASHWVMVGRDITERRSAADAIHRLAYYDVLTGLANRRLLMERLGAIVEKAAGGNRLGAVLYLDLDDFKSTNDARGHAAGDALLSHVAARLKTAVRGSDLVARVGGDEFVVVLEGLDADPAAAARAALDVAETIRAILVAPLELHGQPHHVAASIGVALAAGAGTSAHDLLRAADTAMYRAKSAGRNGVVLFEESMLTEAQEKLTLERDLARAMESGELVAHFQLQVDRHAVPVGAELLTRWQRADGSAVRPDVFIPAAEASGLIVPMGHWVLRQACLAWLALERAGHPLPLSVNVSPLQFRQPDFVAQVRAILAETGAPPQQLIFEVTEGLLIEDIGQAILRMHELAALGIRFSVDDFGTGYSNMAYLTKMPLYELKIDKSFMHETPHDRSGTAIVQSILSMARHLGLRVVAEGIESKAQANYLAAHGGACMQGFLYHRPMPLGRLIEHLDAEPALPARHSAGA